MAAAAILLASVAAGAAPGAAAGACAAGAKCLTVPAARRSAPAYAPGDAFPVYQQSMILNPAAHGLPPVDGPWRYYELDGIFYRVGAADGRVIEVIGAR